MTLDQITAFLVQDPRNLNLLAEGARTAAQEGLWNEVAAMVSRYAEVEPPTTELINLRGLASMDAGDFSSAQDDFQAVLEANPGDPGVAFNLAFSLAQLGQNYPALNLIDGSVVASIPAAAGLKVQLLHITETPEDALAWGVQLADKLDAHPGLAAALAVAAMDAEDYEKAEKFARQTNDSPAGLSTLGMIALDRAELAEAIPMFEQAIDKVPDYGRALLGRGLARMAGGQPKDAAKDFDAAASTFRTHLGTWIAAGWAYFADGDLDTSRSRFETALAIDDTFSECHGGLAVLDAMAGNFEAARRKADIALRLDRMSLGGTLAKILIAKGMGQDATAERLTDMTLNMPITTDGRTISQISASLARGRR